MSKCVKVALAIVLAGLLVGCVERTIKITTQPSGATVILNDEEVGRSPADVRFTWYGTYDVIIRKEGYKTLHTPQKIDPPVYQWPVIDIFTELLIPAKWHDVRTWHFDLEPQPLPQREELLERATQFRQEAQEGSAAKPPVGAVVPAASEPAGEQAPETQPAEQP